MIPLHDRYAKPALKLVEEDGIEPSPWDFQSPVQQLPIRHSLRKRGLHHLVSTFSPLADIRRLRNRGTTERYDFGRSI